MKQSLNPFWLVLFLAFVALLGIFGSPENITAYIICLFFAVIVILHPVNGIYFLLLVVPFFLGNSKRPYYLMLEFFVYATLLSAIFHRSMRKKIHSGPYAYLALLFLGISLCSFPLNIKELFWDLWAWPPLESLRILGSSHEGSNLYYVRTLFNLTSAVFLYFATVSFLQNYKNLSKIFGPVAVIALITIVFGFLFRYNVIPHGGTYLSLSLVGRRWKAVTAFAYNQGYLGQYLVVSFPLIALFLSGWKNHRILSLAFFLMTTMCIAAIAHTFQRGPLVALISQGLLFSVLYWHLSGRTGKNLLFSVGIITGIVAILLIADHFVLSGAGLRRLLTKGLESGRWQLWKVSWQMFRNNPLLGIGLGKHHYFFPEYYGLAELPISWRKLGRSTAHNVFFHLLAEQGITGFGCFIFLIGKSFSDILRKLRVMTQEHRAAAIAIMVSLCGWFVLGLSQNMFYLRCMQIFLWIMLGFLTVTLHGYVQASRISKRTMITTSVCLLVLFSYRVFAVTKYQLPDSYSVGFYNWEVQPDRTKIRWMGKRAAMKIPVEGEELILTCRTALPDLDLRPQKLYIATSDGYSEKVVLNSKDCVEVKIPVKKKIGEYILVKLRTEYVVIPSKEGWSRDTRMLGVMVYDADWAK